MANNFPTIKPSLNLQLARTGILPPDVTFTRASQSGGYYDGKTVAKAEENLLIRSQEFNNAAWTKIGASVVANADTAPDGTLTADTLNEGTNTGLHHIQQSSFSYVSGVTYTQSIHAKADTATVIQLVGQSTAFGVNVFANYDLANGVLGTVGSAATATITSVGDDWYRITLTATAITTTLQVTGLVFLCDNNTTAIRALSYTGTSKQLLIWGAQLEQRSSVTAYTPTTTQPITRFQPKLEYAIANEPVFDHNPVTGEALGLSIFEARTNLLLRSEEFDNAFWTKINSTIEANQIIAPDGTLTADKLVEDTANGQHLVRRPEAVSSGSAFTFSCYVKKSEIETVFIGQTASGGAGISTRTAEINLTDGTITSQTIAGSSRVVNAGNGWYRISLTSATTIGSGGPSFQIGLRQLTSYTGDGTSGIFIWGAQLEAGPFATPYIPTVASTVTRSADVAVMTGANFSRWFNVDQGSLFVEYTAATIERYAFAIKGASFVGDRILNWTNGAFTNPDGSISVPITAAKRAVSYQVNSLKMATNGTLNTEDTSVTNGWSDSATMIIGASDNAGASCMNGYVKSMSYYPIALTSANLQAVTA